jgi:hypothetical protein
LRGGENVEKWEEEGCISVFIEFWLDLRKWILKFIKKKIPAGTAGSAGTDTGIDFENF